MTTLNHVKNKALKTGFYLYPTLGRSYVLTMAHTFAPFKQIVYRGSLFHVNAFLNGVINVNRFNSSEKVGN